MKGLTEHETLPLEVLVLDGIRDHFMELDGEWVFAHVEGIQVDTVMVPDESSHQCAWISAINLLVS